jgi:transposase
MRQVQLHYTEKLLGLKDVQVVDVQETEDSIEITLHPTRTSHPCPHCQRESTRIHDYRMQRIQHVRYGPRSLYYRLRKRRFVCTHCQRRFTERYDWVGRYQRRTQAHMQLILQNLKQIRSLASVARDCHTSPTTVQRIFQWIVPTPPPLPRVLCLDEFKGNTGHEKYQCILVDGTQKRIYDILPSRKQADLEAYFQRFPPQERARVTYAVLDMSHLFADVCRRYLPNAVLVVDKFHFARQCFWALENVRKRCQQSMSVRLRKYYKRSKSLLRKRGDRLAPEEKEKVDLMLWYDPALRDAYLLKEAYYRFLDAPTKREAREKLDEWLHLVRVSDLPEYRDCVRAHTNWKEEILNHFDTGLTNGRTEGFNNKIKVIKRVSFGYRNFANFRRRILYCCS